MNRSFKSFVTSSLFVVFSVSSAHGQAPGWWLRQGAQIENGESNDYALINQGQLKNLARAAYLEMETLLPGGAGSQIRGMIQGWSAPGAAAHADDYAGATLGHLKSVATPFYDRLMAAGLAFDFPWNWTLEGDNDYALANIGQVKHVFSFTLGFRQMATQWEAAHPPAGGGSQGGGGPGGGSGGSSGSGSPYYPHEPSPVVTDTDGDGWSPLKEKAEGTNPESTDSDGDGVVDSEDAVPYDPAFRHARTSVPRFLPVEIGRVEDATVYGDFVLAENGTVAWTKIQPAEDPDEYDTFELYRWNPADAEAELIPLPEDAQNVRLMDISEDGTVLVGSAQDVPDPTLEANTKEIWHIEDDTFRWMVKPPILEGMEEENQVGPQAWLGQEGETWANASTYYRPGAPGNAIGHSIWHWDGAYAMAEVEVFHPEEGVRVIENPPQGPGFCRVGYEVFYDELVHDINVSSLNATNPADPKKVHQLNYKEREKRDVHQKATPGLSYYDEEFHDPQFGSRFERRLLLNDTDIFTWFVFREMDLDQLELDNAGVTKKSPEYPDDPEKDPWIWINTHEKSPEYDLWGGFSWIYDNLDAQIRTHDGLFHQIYCSYEDYRDQKPSQYIRKVNAKGHAMATGPNGMLNRLDELIYRDGLWVNGKVHDWRELVASPDLEKYGEIPYWEFLDINDAGQVLARVTRPSVADPDKYTFYIMLLLPVETPGFNEEGKVVASTEGMSPSMPSPVIDVTQMTVDNVQIDPATTLITATVSVAGSIKSDLCDTLPGADGSINTAWLRVNDQDDQNLNISVSVNKDAGDEIGKPYPYNGTFSATWTGVKLAAEVNTLSVIAKDKIYGIEGYNTWSFSIEVHQPAYGDLQPSTALLRLIGPPQGPPNTFPHLLFHGMDAQFHLNGQLLDDRPLAAFASQGRFHSYRQASAPNEVLLRLISQSAPKLFTGAHDSFPVTYYRPSIGIVGLTFQVAETDANSGILEDTIQVYRPVDPQSGAPGPVRPWPNEYPPNELAVTADQPYEMEASTGGEFHPFAIRIGAPLGLLADDNIELEVDGPGNSKIKGVVRQHGDDGSLLYREDTSKPFVMSFRQKNAESGAPNDIHEGDRQEALERSLASNIQDTGAFMKGFGLGLYDGGYEMVAGTADIAASIGDAVGTQLFWGTLQVTVTIKNIFGADTAQEMTMITSIDNDRKDAINDVIEFLWPLIEFVKDNNEAQFEVLMGMLTWNSQHIKDGVFKWSDTHRKMFMMAADILAPLIKRYVDEFRNANPEKLGRLIGRAVFEIAAIVLPFTKAGNMAQLSKLKFVQELGKRQFFKEGIAKEVFDAVAGVIKPVLGITNICFVAGTQVWTKEGLKPIETIRKGDNVWAREECSKQQTWKTVAETFATHPEQLWHVGFDENGDGVGDETLSCTGNHPFWIEETQKFVPISEAHVGQTVSLADRGTATIVRIKTENAPLGESFTTYNFEVTDYHTYFVGSIGIWVHNVGRAACERALSIYQALRAEGRVPWEAFKSLVNKMPDAPSQTFWLAAGECMKEMLAAGQKLPSYREMKEVMKGHFKSWRKLQTKHKTAFMDSLAGFTYNEAWQIWIWLKLECHHGVPKAIMEFLQIPEEKWDDVPAYLTTMMDHRAGLESLHGRMIQRGIDLKDLSQWEGRKNDLLIALKNSYIDAGIPQLWNDCAKFLQPFGF